MTRADLIELRIVLVRAIEDGTIHPTAMDPFDRIHCTIGSCSYSEFCHHAAVLVECRCCFVKGALSSEASFQLASLFPAQFQQTLFGEVTFFAEIDFSYAWSQHVAPNEPHLA